MTLPVNIDAGARAYFDPPLVITADHDISADTFEVGLGSYIAPPTTWLPSSNAAVLLTRPAPAQAQLTMLIGSTILPATGIYWLWARMTDSPEVLPERSVGWVRVVNTGTVNYT